jgi:hypothetical protein
MSETTEVTDSVEPVELVELTPEQLEAVSGGWIGAVSW